MPKVFVGMSGGVDSAVSALLLKQQNYDVTGVFMKNWDDDEFCSSEQDYQDALAVCQTINIPLISKNFTNEYMEHVFQHTIKQLQQGITPNPDVLCNKEIKFKCFFASCMDMGADFVATGHYAKITQQQEQYCLTKPHDNNKDQTYFLYTIQQATLTKVLFPLADLTKNQVRDIAKQYQLPNFAKKDSTGICFIGERKFNEFINQYLLKTPGAIVDINNNNLGTHQGLAFYTIGQRSGLNLGGMAGYPEQPWYVLQKDIQKNQLIVGQDHNHPLLMQTELRCEQLHWINPVTKNEFSCSAKVRYRQQDSKCKVTITNNNQAIVVFTKPQRAITPGQAIVFYHNELCLGGATIV